MLSRYKVFVPEGERAGGWGVGEVWVRVQPDDRSRNDWEAPGDRWALGAKEERIKDFLTLGPGAMVRTPVHVSPATFAQGPAHSQVLLSPFPALLPPFHLLGIEPSSRPFAGLAGWHTLSCSKAPWPTFSGPQLHQVPKKPSLLCSSAGRQGGAGASTCCTSEPDGLWARGPRVD